MLLAWAFCGVRPLGAELYALVAMTALLREWPPHEVATLDTAVFGHYLRGLREAGWHIAVNSALRAALNTAAHALQARIDLV